MVEAVVTKCLLIQLGMVCPLQMFLFPGRFLWIMGVCIPISINSALKKSIPRRNLLRGTL
ncbi:hypothetical protein B566_EDAN008430, partial [Ephemera danica]